MARTRVDKRINLSPKAAAILKEDAAKARLSESVYIERLIEKRPVIEVNEEWWKFMSEFYEGINTLNQNIGKDPEVTHVWVKAISNMVALGNSKYIYGGIFHGKKD